jgi:hypothetical protein
VYTLSHAGISTAEFNQTYYSILVMMVFWQKFQDLSNPLEAATPVCIALALPT